MKVIVDADPIVYRAGFAGEKHVKRIVWSPQDSDEIWEEFFEPRDGKTALQQYKAWLDKEFHATDGPVILEDQKIVMPEPLENVLATVRAILKDIKYACAEQFQLEADEVELDIVLSGPGNFRVDIATVAPYKGNRKDSHKPHWYQQIRNYLTGKHGARVVEGREADDECSIIQSTEPNTCIATVDKDLDMVPGWHYDYGKKKFYYTKQDEGYLLFYKQLLMGDSTDNIPGAYKIGPVRSAELVDTWFLDYGLDHAAFWSLICDVYAEQLEKYGEKCPYYDLATVEGIQEVVLEQARLLWMQTYEGEMWTPPSWGGNRESKENV